MKKGVHAVYETVFLKGVPKIFGSLAEYDLWRTAIANAAKIRMPEVMLFGSAHVGYSLAPLKFGRPFSRIATIDRRASDLDLSIINERLFLAAWNSVVEQDRKQTLGINRDDTNRLHQNIYYGFLSDKLVPRGSNSFRTIVEIRNCTGLHVVSSGIKVNIRLYRRNEDLFGYQIWSLRNLKYELLNL